MLREISKPTPPKELTPENKKGFETKIIKWLIITDFFLRAI